MKVAISTDGENVSAHFGRCPSFTVIEIQKGKVTNTEEIQNPGHNPGYLPQYFHDMGIECIIAGGMGGRAAGLFGQYSIQSIVGISGKVGDVITQLLNGNLKGGESLCKPGSGKGYGVEKSACDHSENEHDS